MARKRARGADRRFCRRYYDQDEEANDEEEDFNDETDGISRDAFRRQRERMSRAACSLLDAVQRSAAVDTIAMNALGAEGAARAVIDIMLAHRGDDTVVASGLKAFYTITDTMSRPMIDIGNEAAQIFVDAMDTDPEAAAHAIFVACVFHEINATSLWAAGVYHALRVGVASILPEAARYSCEALSAFATNMLYARTLMEAQIAPIAVEALHRHKGDKNVAYAVCLLLGRLAQWDGHISAIGNSGAIDAIAEAMLLNRLDVDSTIAGCCALYWIWRSGDPTLFNVPLVTEALQEILLVHQRRPDCVKVVLDALSRFCYRVSDPVIGLKLANSILSTVRFVDPEPAYIALESLVRFMDEDTKANAIRITKSSLAGFSTVSADVDEHRLKRIEACSITANHLLYHLRGDFASPPNVCESCRSAKITCMVQECGHACLCDKCAQALEQRPYKCCPVIHCAKTIRTDPKRFFLSGFQELDSPSLEETAESVLEVQLPAAEFSVFRKPSENATPMTCVFCLTERPTIMWESCGHLCACKTCADTLTSGEYRNSCPLCRKRISYCLNVRFPWEDGQNETKKSLGDDVHLESAPSGFSGIGGVKAVIGEA